MPARPFLRALEFAWPALAVPLIAVPVAHAAPVTTLAVPTAAQLLARTNSCSVASASKYKTDTEAGATINICRSGSAFFWKADMDIDCDGVTTRRPPAGRSPPAPPTTW